MSSANSSPNEDEVLLAFSVEPSHDRTTLEHYLRRYPEHANALVDCSIELMIDAFRGSDEEHVASEHVVDRSWQLFEATMFPSRDVAAANPFGQLNPTAFKSVAKKMDITNLLLMRFRDRAIDVATIPVLLIQRLAAELGTSVDAVSTYLSNPPAISAGQSFRSNVKPAVTEQISFGQAVETSQLTPAQQEALKTLQR
jgi:hypothetical protein